MKKIKLEKELLEAVETMFKSKKFVSALINSFSDNMNQFEENLDQLNEGDIHYLFFVYAMGAASGIDISNDLEFDSHVLKITGGMQ